MPTSYSWSLGAPTAGPSLSVEAAAVNALREYLLRTLPAKLLELNALRSARLLAPLAGPYTIPSGGILRLQGASGSAVNAALTAGSRTATQIAADLVSAGVTTVVGSQDYQGRLALTASTAPTSGVYSAVVVHPEADGAGTAGVLAALGFDVGGDRAITSALLPPSSRGISDGWPVIPEFAGNGAIAVILGDRNVAPRENIRTDMHLVDVDVTVLRADPNLQVSATKEGIQAAVRAIRECIYADRTLDNPVNADGDRSIMLTEEVSSRVSGRPLVFDGAPNTLFDSADLRLRVKVYERQP